jgi:nicotinamidase-related amidase
MTTTKAVLAIDFIEEIIGVDGKLAAKGYREFADNHRTLDNAAALLGAARLAGDTVIHIGLGFAHGYADHPKGSPLFGSAESFGILETGTTSTEFVTELKPHPADLCLTKKRVSAFYGTGLELTLRTLGVFTVTIAGVATDLAVQSAVRDAHDRDFEVIVATTACAAANEDDHIQALSNMAKIATLI